MLLATIATDEGQAVAAVRDGTVIPLAPHLDLGSMRDICAQGGPALDRIRAWIDRGQSPGGLAVDEVALGPAVPDPGAIYTVGLNYAASDGPDPDRPERPLIFGKAAAAVGGDGARVHWDRSLTANVDPECELGVVIGAEAFGVSASEAMSHVFGYTCINDISSRDEWLDGDQWLLGKSMPGFCPVGPWIVTADALDPDDLRLGCRINGVPVQDGRTSRMRFAIPEIVAFLSRHVRLRPGDLIATGTPARLAGPLGPDRHLEPGDEVTVWIEGIGELRSAIG